MMSLRRGLGLRMPRLQFVVFLSTVPSDTSIQCAHAVNFFAGEGDRTEDVRISTEDRTEDSDAPAPDSVFVFAGEEVLWQEQLFPQSNHILGDPRALAAGSQVSTRFRNICAPALAWQRDHVRVEAEGIEAGIREGRLLNWSDDVPREFYGYRRIIRAALVEQRRTYHQWWHHHHGGNGGNTTDFMRLTDTDWENLPEEVRSDASVSFLRWFSRGNRTFPPEVRVWVTDVPRELRGSFPIVHTALTQHVGAAGRYYTGWIIDGGILIFEDNYKPEHRLRAENALVLSAIKKGVLTDWERDVPEGALREIPPVVADYALENRAMRFTIADWRKLDAGVREDPLAVRVAIYTGLLTDWERDVVGEAAGSLLCADADIVRTAMTAPTMPFTLEDWRKLDCELRNNLETARVAIVTGVLTDWERDVPEALRATAKVVKTALRTPTMPFGQEDWRRLDEGVRWDHEVMELVFGPWGWQNVLAKMFRRLSIL